MNTRTTIIVKLTVDGLHNFPKAAELFPEVSFLADLHRHMFHITAAKQVYHDDRDLEFIMFKRDILQWLHDNYYDAGTRTMLFGAKSCEMIAREIFNEFNCVWVEVWEDNENGAKIEYI